MLKELKKLIIRFDNYNKEVKFIRANYRNENLSEADQLKIDNYARRTEIGGW